MPILLPAFVVDTKSIDQAGAVSSVARALNLQQAVSYNRGLTQ
jgi:hypothetical protein